MRDYSAVRVSLSPFTEELHNGDSPYPQMEPSGEVLPLPTPVEITGRVDGDGSDDEINSSPVSSLERRHAHTHTMSTRRVCWHRNTSISMTEHSLSVRVSVTAVDPLTPNLQLVTLPTDCLTFPCKLDRRISF